MGRHVVMCPYERNLCNGEEVDKRWPWLWSYPGEPLKPVEIMRLMPVCPDCQQIVDDLVIAKEAGIDMEGVIDMDIDMEGV